MLLDRLAHSFSELIVVPPPPSETHDARVGVKKPVTGQVVESGKELSVGEISGGPENDDRTRRGLEARRVHFEAALVAWPPN
jgi:hypothetical protein